MEEELLTEQIEIKYSISDSKRISIIAIMTALAIVGNYIAIVAPNVELGSTILFITAYIFGAQIAVPCTLIMSTIFGAFNPWGPFVFEIWLSQVVGWLFMVATGVLVGYKGPEKPEQSPSWLPFGLIGAFLTLFYDLLTSLAFAWISQMPYAVAVIGGIPFFAVHIVSNFFLFALVVPPLNSILRTQFATQIWDFKIVDEREE